MSGLSGIEAFAAPVQQREQKPVAPIQHGAAVTHREVRPDPRVDPAAVADRKRAAENVRRRSRDGRRETPEQGEEAAEGEPATGRLLDISV